MGRGCQLCELPPGERDRLKEIWADGNSYATIARVAELEELPVSKSGIFRCLKNHGKPKPPKPPPTSGPITFNAVQSWEEEFRKFNWNTGEALRAWRLRAKRAANHAEALRAKQGKT